MSKGSKKRRAERNEKGQKLNNEDVTSCTTSGDSEETVLNGETNNNGLKKDPSIAPYVIVVHGPPKVGKSLLIDSLINYYTSKNHTNVGKTIITGSGNRRRIQFVECPNNMNGMIDAAKYADAVMLLVDAKYGFEMETFEFLHFLQVQGIPKVMGVLTNLDKLKDEDARSTTKKCLIRKFREHI
ncbi:ribosome biogenesis protein BMS1 homolog [Papaver somniferum]|uniref:ribosome biogenesis protein BMS1 homolog n=1 Tax=Papaver somniferum TaxID=3469 RepID=UPI000E6F59B8|nr:ribosome biogenesis protein BMS1 homolog [Papaver somniferum]